MPSNKPRVQTILEEETYKKFKLIAKQDGRTESNFAKRIIEDYISKYESENGEIKINIGNIGQNNGTINMK